MQLGQVIELEVARRERRPSGTIDILVDARSLAAAKSATDMESSNLATEDTGATPIEGGGDEGAKVQRKSIYETALQEMTDEDWSSPAARKFLIEEIRRLQKESDDFRRDATLLRERLANVRSELSKSELEKTRLEGRAGLSLSNELLSYISFGIGIAGIPAGFEIGKIPEMANTSSVILIGSGVLIVAGLFLRIWKR
jgi:hypothetical protein